MKYLIIYPNGSIEETVSSFFEACAMAPMVTVVRLAKVSVVIMSEHEN